MAVTYQSKTSASMSGGVALHQVTLPSGTAVGDLIILFYSMTCNTNAPHPTIVSSGSKGSFGTNTIDIGAKYKNGAYYIYPNATDISNGYVGYTGSDSYSYTGQIELYRITGNTSISEIDYGVDWASSDNTPVWANSVTPVYTNHLLIMLVATAEASFNGTMSSYTVGAVNPTWTEISDLEVNDVSNAAGLHSAYGSRSSTLATGDSSAVWTGSGTITSYCYLLSISETPLSTGTFFSIL